MDLSALLRAFGALALALDLAATPADTMTWLGGGYSDYAPNGMPDFSQCRQEWGRAGDPGRPGQWTFAGPVALADTLWWLDSVAEPLPRPTGEASDGWRLVTAYPRFGPPIDDHDPRTMVQLIEDLALRAHTDGRGEQLVIRGTLWEDLVRAAFGYISSHGLAFEYAVQTVAPPDINILRPMLEQGAGGVLLLGVWEKDPSGLWHRVGGHYAAIAGWAGASEDDRESAGRIALADPLGDLAALGHPGRAQPADPLLHSCRNAPRVHDDAGVVSHDVYRLVSSPALPDSRLVLDGYFTTTSQGEAAAFSGINGSDALKSQSGKWSEGEVVMALDAALTLRPLKALPSAPAPTAVRPATPTPLAPTEETPESTPTADSTRSSTATARPTDPPSPPSTAEWTPTASTTRLPQPTRPAPPTAGPTLTPIYDDLPFVAWLPAILFGGDRHHPEPNSSREAPALGAASRTGVRLGVGANADGPGTRPGRHPHS